MTTGNVKQRTRVLGLDIVRALAILIVVLSHTSGLLKVGHAPGTAAPQHVAQPLPADAAQGAASIDNPPRVHARPQDLPKRGRTWVFSALGVELFFVLSGFLIGNILIRQFRNSGAYTMRHIGHFLVRRWLRTIPVYWFVLTVMVLLWLFVAKKALGLKVALYYFFLQNVVTAHPGFFQVAWSLAVEEWFYLTIPFAIYIAARLLPTLPKQRLLLYCFATYMCCALLLRIANACYLPYGHDFDNGIRKMVLLRLDAPLYGVLMALLYTPGGWLHRHRRLLLGISATATLALIALLYYLEPGGSHTGHWLYMPFNSVLQFTVLPVAMALCLPAAASYAPPQPGPLARAITYTSKISYSAYLTHYYIFYLLGFSRYHAGSYVYMALFYLLYLATVAAVSTGLYRFVEWPVLRWRDRRWGE